MAGSSRAEDNLLTWGQRCFGDEAELVPAVDRGVVGDCCDDRMGRNPIRMARQLEPIRMPEAMRTSLKGHSIEGSVAGKFFGHDGHGKIAGPRPDWTHRDRGALRLYPEHGGWADRPCGFPQDHFRELTAVVSIP